MGIECFSYLRNFVYCFNPHEPGNGSWVYSPDEEPPDSREDARPLGPSSPSTSPVDPRLISQHSGDQPLEELEDPNDV